MRRSLGWIAGALGLAGAYRALKRQSRPVSESRPDPRAEELRRRLDEVKPLADERERFEAGETPVDAAPDPAPGADPDAKRRDVHERARAAIDEMQRDDAG